MVDAHANLVLKSRTALVVRPNSADTMPAPVFARAKFLMRYGYISSLKKWPIALRFSAADEIDTGFRQEPMGFDARECRLRSHFSHGR